MKLIKKQIWQLLKEKVYYQDGSLRDIYMLNSMKNDWQKFVDFVNQNYRIEWYDSKSDKIYSEIDFELIKNYWEQRIESSTAKIYTGNIQINAHFFTDLEIENDIDPREFESIQQHYELLRYLNQLSDLCDKPIIVTPENSPNIVLMKVYKGKMEVGYASS